VDDAAEVLKEIMGEVGEREYPGTALRAACGVIRNALKEGSSPYVELAAAAGLSLDDLPAEDEDLWLALAAQTLWPAGADLDVTVWLGVIAALTLWGAGTQADAEALAAYVGEDSGLEASVLEEAFIPVVERWMALGVLEATERLTPLGWWGIPEAQLRVWS
jgi:hypothetical protein